MIVYAERDKKTLGEFIADNIEGTVEEEIVEFKREFLEELEEVYKGQKDKGEDILKEFTSKFNYYLVAYNSYVVINVVFDFLKLPKHLRYKFFSLERRILDKLEEKFKDFRLTVLPYEKEYEFELSPFKKENIANFVKFDFKRKDYN